MPKPGPEAGLTEGAHPGAGLGERLPLPCVLGGRQVQLGMGKGLAIEGRKAPLDGPGNCGSEAAPVSSLLEGVSRSVDGGLFPVPPHQHETHRQAVFEAAG